jgi:hypothetical protein
VGAGIVGGWEATPPRDWSRNAGDAVLTSEDEGVEGSLLRPRAEAQTHAEVETVVRLNPPGFGVVAFGIAGRIGPGQGYRFVLEPESATRTGLFLVKTDGTGIRVQGRVSLPILLAGRDYRLTARFHGPVIQARLSEAAADAPVIARLLVVDDAPLGPGQFGVLARTRGQVRFRGVSIRPAMGYPARVVGTGATAFTYDPLTVSLEVAAPAPLLVADGLGFTATVDGRPRAVDRVTLRRAAVDVTLDGPPLEPGQDIRLSYDPTAGYVYDDSPVPQPLGPIDALPVAVVEAAVLTSTRQVGENILALAFARSPAQGALTVEGDGGIDVDVTAPSLGPDPVRFGVDEVWVDPASDGDRLFLATTDDLPDDARVQLSTDQRPGARIVDVLGTPLADFAVDAIAEPGAAIAEVGADFPTTWSFDWDGPSGWPRYAAPEDAWVELPGRLVARGSRVFDLPTVTFAPVARSGRDLRVSVDFALQPDTTPFGRPATPGIVVRGYNDGTYLVCHVRTDPGRIPARDEDGHITVPAERIDPTGPALVCARRLDFGAPRVFEGCRMQFYDDRGRRRSDRALRLGGRPPPSAPPRGRRGRARLRATLVSPRGRRADARWRPWTSRRSATISNAGLPGRGYRGGRHGRLQRLQRRCQRAQATSRRWTPRSPRAASAAETGRRAHAALRGPEASRHAHGGEADEIAVVVVEQIELIVEPFVPVDRVDGQRHDPDEEGAQGRRLLDDDALLGRAPRDLARRGPQHHVAVVDLEEDVAVVPVEERRQHRPGGGGRHVHLEPVLVAGRAVAHPLRGPTVLLGLPEFGGGAPVAVGFVRIVDAHELPLVERHVQVVARVRIAVGVDVNVVATGRTVAQLHRLTVDGAMPVGPTGVLGERRALPEDVDVEIALRVHEVEGHRQRPFRGRLIDVPIRIALDPAERQIRLAARRNLGRAEQDLVTAAGLEVIGLAGHGGGRAVEHEAVLRLGHGHAGHRDEVGARGELPGPCDVLPLAVATGDADDLPAGVPDLDARVADGGVFLTDDARHEFVVGRDLDPEPILLAAAQPEARHLEIDVGPQFVAVPSKRGRSSSGCVMRSCARFWSSFGSAASSWQSRRSRSTASVNAYRAVWSAFRPKTRIA